MAKNIFSYKWWWTRFGGRPWTFILRDIWHKFEWLPQMWWLLTGAVIYAIWGWVGIVTFIVIYSYGYLQGHLKWGNIYIPNQQGSK